jgi:hypothetical protein
VPLMFIEQGGKSGTKTDISLPARLMSVRSKTPHGSTTS